MKIFVVSAILALGGIASASALDGPVGGYDQMCYTQCKIGCDVFSQHIEMDVQRCYENCKFECANDPSQRPARESFIPRQLKITFDEAMTPIEQWDVSVDEDA